MGSWAEHVTSRVGAPNLNIEVIRYEDMLTNSRETFTRAAKFLELPTEPDCIAKAIEFSNFKELSRQESEKGFRERPRRVERFFRQGQIGDGKYKPKSEQIRRIVECNRDVMKRFGRL